MWLLLTPEEWVRQHLVNFLVEERKFPRSLIALERGLKVNTMHRRTDLLAYTKDVIPVFIAECKAPAIKLDQHVFDQAAKYNSTLRVPYLMITNGLKHFCCYIDLKNNSYRFLNDIPFYDEMKIG